MTNRTNKNTPVLLVFMLTLTSLCGAETLTINGIAKPRFELMAQNVGERRGETRNLKLDRIIETIAKRFTDQTIELTIKTLDDLGDPSNIYKIKKAPLKPSAIEVQNYNPRTKAYILKLSVKKITDPAVDVRQEGRYSFSTIYYRIYDVSYTEITETFTIKGNIKSDEYVLEKAKPIKRPESISKLIESR